MVVLVSERDIVNLVKDCGCKVVYQTYLETIFPGAWYNGVIYIPCSVKIEGNKEYYAHEQRCPYYPRGKRHWLQEL